MSNGLLTLATPRFVLTTKGFLMPVVSQSEIRVNFWACEFLRTGPTITSQKRVKDEKVY